LEECSSDGEEDQDGSSNEDIETGKFLNKIEKERSRARHKSRYLMSVLKSNSRIGSIFFDKAKRVSPLSKGRKDVYDYLIEWQF